MMWTAERALNERTEYSQLGANRWRATYRGFVSLTVEGNDPRNAQRNLEEAFDLLLANLIRSSHRPLTAEPDAVNQASPRPAARHAAKALRQQK
jgi:predicted RNase H-like HicB family nuclease